MNAEYLALLFALLWIGTLILFAVCDRARRATIRRLQDVGLRLENALVGQIEFTKAQTAAIGLLREQLNTSQRARFDLITRNAKLTVTNNEQRAALEVVRREQFARPED